jgi:hypothetical protein
MNRRGQGEETQGSSLWRYVRPTSGSNKWPPARPEELNVRYLHPAERCKKRNAQSHGEEKNKRRIKETAFEEEGGTSEYRKWRVNPVTSWRNESRLRGHESGNKSRLLQSREHMHVIVFWLEGSGRASAESVDGAQLFPIEFVSANVSLLAGRQSARGTFPPPSLAPCYKYMPAHLKAGLAPRKERASAPVRGQKG